MDGMGRLNRRECILSNRLKWLHDREDAFKNNQGCTDLTKIRAEIQGVMNELRALRTRRSRFLYCVIGKAWDAEDNH